MRDNVRLDDRPLARVKPHRRGGRPPFDCIALLLQGGGALGAYQGGVYEGLVEAGLHPDWTAGISIGAINAALIAGNPPEQRVEKLRKFWELVTSPHPQWPFQSIPTGRSASANEDGDFAPWLSQLAPWRHGNKYAALFKGDAAHSLLNQWSAARALSLGASGFFAPRSLTPWLWPRGSIEATSCYDTRALRSTLERLVDFDRINGGALRLSVGAVNVRTGNFVYFDSTTHRIRPEHVMASGALPPGFPAIEIDGEH